MENVQQTIQIRGPPPRRAISMPPGRGGGRRLSQRKFSYGHPRKQRDPNFTEEDELELYRMVCVGG